MLAHTCDPLVYRKVTCRTTKPDALELQRFALLACSSNAYPAAPVHWM